MSVLARYQPAHLPVLAGGSIMARRFGSLGHGFEFRSSPGSFHLRNCARRQRRQQRGDDGFGFVRFRNDHEVAVPSREVKAQKLAACILNKLAERNLAVRPPSRVLQRGLRGYTCALTRRIFVGRSGVH